MREDTETPDSEGPEMTVGKKQTAQKLNHGFREKLTSNDVTEPDEIRHF